MILSFIRFICLLFFFFWFIGPSLIMLISSLVLLIDNFRALDYGPCYLGEVLISEIS